MPCRAAPSRKFDMVQSRIKKNFFVFLVIFEEKILKCFNFANGNQLERCESSWMSFAFVVVGLGIMGSFVLSLLAPHSNFGSRRRMQQICESEP